MDPQIVDRIYESSFLPELWPGVLGELAGIAQARTGFLFISNGSIHDWASSTDIGIETVKPLVESGWIARCERFRRFLSARHSGFLSDSDLYTEEEMKADPFYRDMLYPRGLGWAVATSVPLPTGDCFSISLEREHSLGPADTSTVHELDLLRPHLARSALMFARLQLERAHAASQTLAAIGLPALVMTEDGRVLAANHLIEKMAGQVQWLAHGRFGLKDRQADKLLREAITKSSSEKAAGVRSFPVRGVDAQHTLVAHVIPIRLSARDIFSRCAVALVLTPVAAPQAPQVELVQSLFDLTPAEARVARGLASGTTVDGIASAGGVSANTVRTHVRAVLAKTGCTRQTEVVALLTGIWSPQRTDETPGGHPVHRSQ